MNISLWQSHMTNESISQRIMLFFGVQVEYLISFFVYTINQKLKNHGIQFFVS